MPAAAPATRSEQSYRSPEAFVLNMDSMLLVAVGRETCFVFPKKAEEGPWPPGSQG